LYEHEMSGLRSLCLYRSDALRSLPMGPEGSAAEQRRGGGRPQSYEGWDAGPAAKVWNARYQVDIQETHPGRSSKQEIEQGRQRPSAESCRPCDRLPSDRIWHSKPTRVYIVRYIAL